MGQPMLFHTFPGLLLCLPTKLSEHPGFLHFFLLSTQSFPKKCNPGLIAKFCTSSLAGICICNVGLHNFPFENFRSFLWFKQKKHAKSVCSKHIFNSHPKRLPSWKYVMAFAIYACCSSPHSARNIKLFKKLNVLLSPAWLYRIMKNIIIRTK